MMMSLQKSTSVFRFQITKKRECRGRTDEDIPQPFGIGLSILSFGLVCDMIIYLKYKSYRISTLWSKLCINCSYFFTKVVLSSPFVTKRTYDGKKIQISPPRRKIFSVVLERI